jgi:hypothetical protein
MLLVTFFNKKLLLQNYFTKNMGKLYLKINKTIDYQCEFCYWDSTSSNHQTLMDNLCIISLKDGKGLLCLLIKPYLIVSNNKKTC